MSDEAYWIIACKIWEDRASPQEQEQLAAWAGLDGNTEKLAHFRHVWEMTAAGDVPAFDTGSSWQELQARLVLPQKKSIQLLPFFIKIAASVLLLIAALFYLPGLWTVEILAIQTDTHEQRLVVLPDSTHVWLNAGSTLEYPETFTGSKRLVSLQGEAFFDVTKDPQRPFVIQTAATETKVLGTSFSVKALAGEPVTVTVATGQVQFRALAGEHKVVLRPGDAGVFNPAQQTLTAQVNDDPRFLEWHNRTLVFSKTTLAHVLQTLEAVYRIHIDATRQRPDTTLDACVFTGTFEDAACEEILEVLAVSVGFEWLPAGKDHYVLRNITCQ